MDNLNFKENTQRSLHRELEKIEHYYMEIYDEYYSDNPKRDSAFLKDLADCLIGISAVLEVYVDHKGVHPNYALEKLNFSKSILNSVISYYENIGGGEKNEN